MQRGVTVTGRLRIISPWRCFMTVQRNAENVISEEVAALLSTRRERADAERAAYEQPVVSADEIAESRTAQVRILQENYRSTGLNVEKLHGDSTRPAGICATVTASERAAISTAASDCPDPLR
jgi:hypothetical protein